MSHKSALIATAIDAYLAVVEAVHNDLVERTGLSVIAQAFPGATAAAAPRPRAAASSNRR